MKQKKYLISWIGLLLTALISFCGLVYFAEQGREAESEYEAAKKIAGITETYSVPEKNIENSLNKDTEYILSTNTTIHTEDCPEELKNINLDELRKQNYDIAGWIYIPDTEISYPIMQSSDPEYYLTHTWLGTENPAGAIFMEKQNSADFSDFHTILYGHNMKNGSMFGELKNYREPEYWKLHPYLYVADDEGIHKYEIFAAFETDVDSSVYQTAIRGEEEKKEFINFSVGKSVIHTGKVPNAEEKILTLSTCTAGGSEKRFVVQSSQTR